MGQRTRGAKQARFELGGGRLRALRRRLNDAWRGARFGPIIGLAMAALALLVGAGGIAFALLLGTKVALPTREDATLLGASVGAFALAGAIVGAIHRLWSNGLLTTIGFMAGGALAMNVIAVASGGLPAYDRADAILMSVIGAAFGLAAAYGIARHSQAVR